MPWNRVGLTHICFNVHNTQRWCDYLVARGVECVCPPERSARGQILVFVRDPDGKLIELTDLRYMYHGLGRLGPLGGFLFRHCMYKRYYEWPSACVRPSASNCAVRWTCVSISPGSTVNSDRS